MLKVLFLILAVMSSAVFAQTAKERESPAGKTPEAYKFFEAGKIGNSLLKEKFQSFYAELKKNHAAIGYIINYGTDKEISRREKQIRSAINSREDYDAPRLILINGGNSDKPETVFWIVPPGAEPPTP